MATTTSTDVSTVVRRSTASTANGRAHRSAELASERVVVTPDVARAWLDKNDGNRARSARHVKKLARDMKNGHWEYTGDPVRFSATGRLIDGQHRLMACIEADVPFETEVIYNLPDSVQVHIDAGKARSAGDILSMDGYHHTQHVAAAARLLLMERDGDIARKEPWTTSDILELLGRHKQLPASVREVASRKMPRGVAVAQVSMIHYVGYHLLNAPKVADSFVSVLHTGVPAYAGDAAHAYRERIIKGGAVASYNLTRSAKWNLLKHAWNLFSAGQTTRLLRPPEDVEIFGLKPSMI